MHIFKKTSKHLNKDSLDVVLDFLSDEKVDMKQDNDFEDSGDDEDVEMEDA
jgi:hypothetical protein